MCRVPPLTPSCLFPARMVKDQTIANAMARMKNFKQAVVSSDDNSDSSDEEVDRRHKKGKGKKLSSAGVRARREVVHSSASRAEQEGGASKRKVVEEDSDDEEKWNREALASMSRKTPDQQTLDISMLLRQAEDAKKELVVSEKELDVSIDIASGSSRPTPSKVESPSKRANTAAGPPSEVIDDVEAQPVAQGRRFTFTVKQKNVDEGKKVYRVSTRPLLPIFHCPACARVPWPAEAPRTVWARRTYLT